LYPKIHHFQQVLLWDLSNNISGSVLILENRNIHVAKSTCAAQGRGMGRNIPDIANENKVPTPSLVVDAAWLLGILAVLSTTQMWQWLSPRPEISQVAILWLPNAVLAVALLRNWGRVGFCSLALVVFMAMGVFPAFKNDTLVSAITYLSIDIVEAMVLAFGLVWWFGAKIRLNTTLTVTAFGVAAAFACLLSAGLAAVASQVPLGASPISSKEPLQVGVAWFTSNLATYFLFAAPLLAMTGRGGRYILSGLNATPVTSALGALAVLVLTFVGFALPSWLAATTGLALGTGGLILIAFPLATYLAFKRGPAIAAITGAAISMSAIYATMAGIGPFGAGNAAANVFDMQATLIVSVFSLLLIGAMGDEMRARSSALERALDEAIKMRQNRP
jgi:hypothetical protein